VENHGKSRKIREMASLALERRDTPTIGCLTETETARGCWMNVSLGDHTGCNGINDRFDGCVLGIGLVRLMNNVSMMGS
jgi:hypothetical protein